MKDMFAKYIEMAKQNKGFLIETGITVLGGLLGILVVAIGTKPPSPEEPPTDPEPEFMGENLN